MAVQQLSEFGKLVRIARLETGKSLKEMAEFAKVSSAYLSAVETGRKEITDRIVDEIATFLGFNDDETLRLQTAANRSNGKVRVNIDSLSDVGVETVTLFARYSLELPPEALDRIGKKVREELAHAEIVKLKD